MSNKGPVKKKKCILFKSAKLGCGEGGRKKNYVLCFKDIYCRYYIFYRKNVKSGTW